jgi:type IV pilus assembly protein PilQ
MKKNLSKTFIVFIILVWVFIYTPGIALAEETADKNMSPENKTEAVVDNVGNLENILFAKLPGKERIQLVVSQQPVIDVKSKTSGSFLIKLENMMAPESLCRPLGEGELNNVISVTPSQKLIKDKQFVYLTIDIKKNVPYAIRQEGKNLFIDFNVSSLVEKKAHYSKKKVIAKVNAETAKNEAKEIAPVKDEAKKVTPPNKEEVKNYTDQEINIDFNEGTIEEALQAMAIIGHVNIVTSPDVKGPMSHLSMKKVPWTKALDTILNVNSLSKQQENNVIIVTTMDRKKRDDEARLKAIDDENKRKDQEHKDKAEKGLLKQVLIEAKIVEATEDFVRNIGVQWGFGNQQKIVAGSTYGLGVTGGSNTSSTNPYTQIYPSQIGKLGTAGSTTSNSTTASSLSMAAVNFPAVIASPAIGLVFGGATGFLETQLAALETNGTGKLISSPKVVTMEGIKAVIKQGAEVPYTTPASGTSPATVSFKEALLSLEVTPKITDEGKISMDIKASNDSPDFANEILGNPPIKKSEVESKVVISDGETIVIGGVMVSDEEKNVQGWPWLQKIPVLGWLFKTESVTKSKKQLLIFVTPRILQSDYRGETPEKIIN